MADGAGEDGADGEGIVAEDALLLLGMAARYATRGGPSVVTACRRATLVEMIARAAALQFKARLSFSSARLHAGLVRHANEQRLHK